MNGGLIQPYIKFINTLNKVYFTKFSRDLGVGRFWSDGSLTHIGHPLKVIYVGVSRLDLYQRLIRQLLPTIGRLIPLASVKHDPEWLLLRSHAKGLGLIPGSHHLMLAPWWLTLITNIAVLLVRMPIICNILSPIGNGHRLLQLGGRLGLQELFHLELSYNFLRLWHDHIEFLQFLVYLLDLLLSFFLGFLGINHWGECAFLEFLLCLVFSLLVIEVLWVLL